MKKILFSLFLLIITFPLYSQPESWYFSLSMGGAFPLNSFANKNAVGENAGFASKGFTLVLDASRPISDNWALKGMVMLNNHPINHNGFGTVMENRMKQQVTFNDKSERDFLSLTIDPWLWNSIMTGPVYSIHLRRFYWDFQVLAGMNVIYLPKQKLEFKNPANNWEYYQQNTTSTNISYGLTAGTGLRYDMTESTCIKISADYFRSYAKTKYEEIKVTKTGNTYETSKLASGTTGHPLETLSFTIGIVYYLP